MKLFADSRKRRSRFARAERLSVLFLLLALICMSACGSEPTVSREAPDLKQYLLSNGFDKISEDGGTLEEQDASALLTEAGIDPLLCRQAVYYASDRHPEKILLVEADPSVDLEQMSELLEQYAKDHFDAYVDVLLISKAHLLCMVVSGSGVDGQVYENRIIREWLYLRQSF